MYGVKEITSTPKDITANWVTKSIPEYKNYSDKVIKNSVGEDELSLPFNKKSFILHREV
jgi:hypothetical protein